jgi:L,D-transpeptidase YbiS
MGVLLVLAPAGLVLLGALCFWSTGYGYSRVRPRYEARHFRYPPPEQSVDDLEAALVQAEAQIAKCQPKGAFIVIDRVRNRLHLREGDQLLLTAVISAGMGSILEDPRDKTGEKKWVFDTPVGRFFVRGRRQNPLWTAPDWEYIESGEPMPRNYEDRVQSGMLGEYALDLGGGPPGYMIHGTIYTRLLGRNVSHGCIRVGKEDLRVLWKKMPVGSTVFMY